VLHYEPPLPSFNTGGEAEAAPGMLACLSKYDVDALRRYPDIFQPGEPVLVTEKIHGASARYCFSQGRMWCGSRTEWKRYSEDNLWWRALAATPALEAFCRDHPDWVVYGEVYGAVQSLRYGCKKNEVRFAAFDLLPLESGLFIAADLSRQILEEARVPCVPLLVAAPFDFEQVCSLAEGPSCMPGADHVREGCVVKPLAERWHQAIGRVILKVVGAGYLEKG